MNTRRTINIVIRLMAGFLFGFVCQEDAEAVLTAKANHDHISIDTFYHGSTVSVSGECENGTDIVVKITAPEEETVLQQKGKVGGFLWMNTNELEFDDTPGLYLVRSTEDLDRLLKPEEADRYVLGYRALEDHVRIDKSMQGNSKDQWFGEFVKFKEEKNIYRVDTEKITYSGRDGKRFYYTLFQWPYQARPGDYRVDVYAVKEGKVIDTAQSSVLVEQAGAVKFLATTANNNSAVYGIMSIVVALASGFGIGMMVKSGGGAH